jgi:hypothetical protein
LGALLPTSFGLLSSYRLIVKGDNRPYGLTSKILTALYFLSNMAGFGTIFERIMHFENPCAGGDEQFPNSSRKPIIF